MRTCFGPFLLDREARQLWRGKEEIRLSPKAFDLLTSLLQARPNVIAKETLQKLLWPDTFVVDGSYDLRAVGVPNVYEDVAVTAYAVAGRLVVDTGEIHVAEPTHRVGAAGP